MNAGRAFVGALLVAFGLVFVLDAAGVLRAGDTIGRWWPSAIVVLGLLHGLDRRRVTPATAVLVLAGAGLLAITTGVFGSEAWSYVWPIALIGSGAWLVAGWWRQGPRQTPDVAVLDGLALLSATRVATRSQAFRHSSLTAVLGGITLDLTQALPVDGGGVVDATAVLGGVSVLVPRGWAVDLRGVPLLGAWDDTTDRTAIHPGAPRLEVRALVVLGGIEVKHSSRWSGSRQP